MSRVLCFGEVLWDLLPGGRCLGGAPLNVAYHLARLGHETAVVSAVGRDALGAAAIAAIEAAGIDHRDVAQHPWLPTGVAEASLDAAGNATYRLLEPVAWDDIPVERGVVEAKPPAAIIYGTLALRRRENRAALARLLHAFPFAWPICDVNLRPPHDDLAPLDPFLRRAAVLKVNEAEARRLAPPPLASPEADRATLARAVRARFEVHAVCLTSGAAGAGLLVGERWFTAEAPRVVVRDTVGAGDAFTAAFMATVLASEGAQPDWPAALAAGCRLGAFVSGHPGAQPRYERAEAGV